MALDKTQITTIQDGQTGAKVSADTKANFDLLVDEVNKKVDKDGSKVLSEKNFTAAYETKLKGIAEGANKYVLPAASSSAMGGVKQGAAVADAAADNVTQAEFNALLASLRAAGIIAES